MALSKHAFKSQALEALMTIGKARYYVILFEMLFKERLGHYGFDPRDPITLEEEEKMLLAVLSTFRRTSPRGTTIPAESWRAFVRCRRQLEEIRERRQKLEDLGTIVWGWIKDEMVLDAEPEVAVEAQAD